MKIKNSIKDNELKALKKALIKKGVISENDVEEEKQNIKMSKLSKKK